MNKRLYEVTDIDDGPWKGTTINIPAISKPGDTFHTNPAGSPEDGYYVLKRDIKISLIWVDKKSDA